LKDHGTEDEALADPEAVERLEVQTDDEWQVVFRPRAVR